MKLCGKLNGYCVHQEKDSCDGCKLMEMWLNYKEKSLEMESQEIINKTFKENLE